MVCRKKNVWLIIPLFRQNEMEAFVVLTQAKVPRQLNWEDHDLLKTVGMQLTNALALAMPAMPCPAHASLKPITGFRPIWFMT